jgi:hypothetical protein
VSVSANSNLDNIRRLLRQYLSQLDRLPADEYVVLRHELADSDEYVRPLALLNDHLAIAEEKCAGFDRLLRERRRLGTDIDGVNAMILDKLAEVRAIVGLDEWGFQDIEFSASPDFTATWKGTQYAIEVTRISASGGVREPPEDIEVLLVKEGDASDLLWRQIITKASGKRDQFLRASRTDSNHIVWVSTGRDYFTVGRYEPDPAGLREDMPKHLEAMLQKAIDDSRIKVDYPELAFVGASPGRDAKPILLKVEHSNDPP